MVLTKECITSSRVRPGARAQSVKMSVSAFRSISGAMQVSNRPFSSMTGKRCDLAGEPAGESSGLGWNCSEDLEFFCAPIEEEVTVFAAPFAHEKATQAANVRSAT